MKKSLLILMAALTCLPLFAGGEQEPVDSGLKILDYYVNEEPQTLDAQQLIGAPDMLITNMFIEGLARFGQEEGKYVPGVAESWSYNEAENSYTFQLRDNSLWDNGTPVTGNDFVYAWRRAIDLRTPYSFLLTQYILGSDKYSAYTNETYLAEKDSDFAKLISPDATDVMKNMRTDRINNMSATELTEFQKIKDDLWNKEAGVAISGNSLKVELASPCPYFVGLTAFPVYFPMQETFVNTHPDDYTLEVEGLISNGPWKIVEWEHNAGYKLVKNENYWNRENIELDELNIRVVIDVETRTNLLKTGGLDGSAIQAKDLPDFQDLATLEQYGLQEMVNMSDFAVFYLEFNHKDNPVTENENIRKAFAYAMDRTAFVEKINIGDNPALAFIPTFFPGLDRSFREENSMEMFIDNQEVQASVYLKNGLKELNLNELPPQDMLIGTSDITRKIAEKFQADWAEIGITVNLVPLPWPERMNRLNSSDFGIFSGGWGPDYMDPMTYLDLFETGNGNNHGGYSNPEYDSYIQSSRLETNAAKRMEYLYKAEKHLIENMVMAPQYFRIAHWTYKNYLTGVVNRGAGPSTDFYWADIDMSAKLVC